MIRELITFEVEGQVFGLDIMAIREIRAWTPTTRLPRVPHYVAGVVNLRGTVLPELLSVISVEEVGNYVTERFINEPDLWRVHLRTTLGLLAVIEATTAQGDEAARAVRNAEYFFFAGLFTVGVAFATLIAVVTF